jgi:hypothetical protein
MGIVPFAFSVHHFIDSVGADAGFAALIGLAILTLLYFAHARETASLREQVYEWAQRAQQLEARVAHLSRQQSSVSTPAPPAQAQTATGATGATGATREVPAAAREVPAATGAAPAVAGAVAHQTTAAPTTVHALAGAPAGTAAPALTAATKLIPTPADIASEPATVAGGANGASLYDHGASTPAGGGMASPPPRIQLRQGTPPPGRRATVPPRSPQQRPGSRGRLGLMIVLVALITAVVVAGVVLLTSGASKPKQANTSASASNASAQRHPSTGTPTAPVKPASVTVAVLNGTAQSGLAGRVSQKLTTGGYKPGTVATAADQTRTSTEIAFMPGHRREALTVAKSLNLGPASVQPVDQSTQAVACPPPAACTADVVVTVGTDLASTQ